MRISDWSSDVCSSDLQVKVDFLGKIDGAAFEGGEGKDVQFELGEGRFLPELEAGIVGHAVGESFVVDVKFPEDYRAEALRGKASQFDVTIKELREPKLPEDRKSTRLNSSH